MPQDRRRVVWFEGMSLDPHHFQQWDRYHLGVLDGRIQALSRFFWGCTALEINRERLANGEFVLVKGSGIMPDGLVFDIPESDDPPAPRSIQEAFGATEERLPVYLAAPLERPDGGNVLLQGSPSRWETRYRAETIFLPDDNGTSESRQVEVAYSGLQLRMGNESLHDFTSIKIAEVVRTTGGLFALSETFVPTSLTVSASERLQTLGRRILELLVTKSSSLLERHRAAAMQREVSPADVAALGLLTTINTFVPLLNHDLLDADSHPERLYRTLLALAGQLTALVPEAGIHPRTLPSYDHADLSTCFNKLDAMLLQMLGGAKVQANYVEIPLQLIRENLYSARLDANLVQKAQLFLIVRSQDIPEQRLVNELPAMLRIADPEIIDAVLRSYTRALGIEHTHRLPSALPVDAQANYFELQKRGPFWDSIAEKNTLALFIPAEFSKITMKLVAVSAP